MYQFQSSKDILDLFKNTNYWISKLSSNDRTNFPKNWTRLTEVRLAHIFLIEKFLDNKFIVPSYKINRGIVIGAGGAKYFGCAFACVYALRKLGCQLPIEFWYLDEYEMDNHMKNLCDIYNIKYINAYKYCKDNNLNPRILNGWELKPFSTLHSSFKEVLYLDADNIPAVDPTYLFDTDQFKSLGSIFWPDLSPWKRKEWITENGWNNIGLDYRNEPDFETGQYMIDKQKCFKELSLTMWINEHSDWFYEFVYGDKSTFHLAWRKCSSDYGIPNKKAGWIHPCILQYDFNNNLVFQHACQGKEMMFSGIGPTNQKNFNLIKEAKKERDQYWNGTIFSWEQMTNEEKDIAKSYIGKYKYTRINLDNRNITLSDNGIVSEGSARCERRWSVRIIDKIPNIILIGSVHKDSEIAMFFAKDDGSGRNFYGQWVAYEKCNISLERV